jgi:hypothetical protein
VPLDQWQPTSEEFEGYRQCGQHARSLVSSVGDCRLAARQHFDVIASSGAAAIPAL